MQQVLSQRVPLSTPGKQGGTGLPCFSSETRVPLVAVITDRSLSKPVWGTRHQQLRISLNLTEESAFEIPAQTLLAHTYLVSF